MTDEFDTDGDCADSAVLLWNVSIISRKTCDIKTLNNVPLWVHHFSLKLPCFERTLLGSDNANMQLPSQHFEHSANSEVTITNVVLIGMVTVSQYMDAVSSQLLPRQRKPGSQPKSLQNVYHGQSTRNTKPHISPIVAGQHMRKFQLFSFTASNFKDTDFSADKMSLVMSPKSVYKYMLPP